METEVLSTLLKSTVARIIINPDPSLEITKLFRVKKYAAEKDRIPEEKSAKFN